MRAALRYLLLYQPPSRRGQFGAQVYNRRLVRERLRR
nr:MAG TPA: hypothetical protein [Caudoviricetes sp.]